MTHSEKARQIVAGGWTDAEDYGDITEENWTCLEVDIASALRQEREEGFRAGQLDATKNNVENFEFYRKEGREEYKAALVKEFELCRNQALEEAEKVAKSYNVPKEKCDCVVVDGIFHEGCSCHNDSRNWTALKIADAIARLKTVNQ